MKAIMQRVLFAEVSINKKIISSIKNGFLIFLGIEKNDTDDDLNYLIDKSTKIRIFNDNKNKMNLSIKNVSGEALVVSQFTLCADIEKGRRPSFINAEHPKQAKVLYDKFCTLLMNQKIPVKKGVFGATMQISLINDGPVTIILDSCNK